MDSDGYSKNIHRRDFLKLTGVGVATLFLGHAGDAQALSKSRITIATGTPAGKYFAIGGSIARLLSKYASTEAVIEITAGSLENCELVAAQKSHLGLAMMDTAYEAFRGIGRFQGNPLPLRMLTILYPNLTHIVSLDSKKIQKVGDLKGKVIAIGSTESGTEGIAARIIISAALDRASELKKVNMGHCQSVVALKNDKIDAYICSGGLPADSVRELSEQPGLHITLIGHADLVPIMNRKYGPVYYKSIIPAGTYKGLAEDVAVSTVENILFCHRDLDEQKAYTVLKTLFERLNEFSSVHKEATRINLTIGASSNLMLYHPGAGKFFREHGLGVPV